MRNIPGTYALVFKSVSNQQINVGKLGRFHLRPGFYLYIGSAFGPGGLKARISHHTGISSHPHWHIDSLRSILLLKEVWYTVGAERHEHRWAAIISGLKGATIPIAGFGATDCNCRTHLIAFKDQPSIRSFRRRVHSQIQGHGSIFQEKLINKVKTSGISS